MSTLGLRVDQVLTTTRAVRKRLDLDRPVEPEVIRDCLEIALQAPSGSNNQSWHFVVVMDEDRRAEVAAVYRKAFADYEAGPLNPARMPADDADQHAAQQRVFRSAAYLAQHLHRVPCLLVPVATGRVERLTSAHRQANYWAGIIPAVWSFMPANAASARRGPRCTCGTSRRSPTSSASPPPSARRQPSSRLPTRSAPTFGLGHDSRSTRSCTSTAGDRLPGSRRRRAAQGPRH
jgi:nitroreductase